MPDKLLVSRISHRDTGPGSPGTLGLGGDILPILGSGSGLRKRGRK